jgi:L-alanine-DL-glutamate epimerase-like enolase superfamily enzyme
MTDSVRIDGIRVQAYTIPTDIAEADGTYEWDRTTIVVTHVNAGGASGLGYSYTDAVAAAFIRETLSAVVIGRDPFAIGGIHDAMLRKVRNIGRGGLVATAISALDTALWDLKAKLLECPLCALLGARRESVALYGSGGFTSYSLDQLKEQLGSWASQGFRWVKMKVGTCPEEDPGRVKAARAAIGNAGLFVDANGAYSRKQALKLADRFNDAAVAWFEEPVSSDDLEGLHLLQSNAPTEMEIAAGEYGFDTVYFRRMLDAGAVDVLQADATRCLGFTGLLAADALCAARMMPLSLHCAPALHCHAALSLRQFRHQEWFHDHARIEHLMFDGAPDPRCGTITPDKSRHGIGLELKAGDVEKYAVR